MQATPEVRGVMPLNSYYLVFAHASSRVNPQTISRDTLALLAS